MHPDGGGVAQAALSFCISIQSEIPLVGRSFLPILEREGLPHPLLGEGVCQNEKNHPINLDT